MATARTINTTCGVARVSAALGDLKFATPPDFSHIGQNFFGRFLFFAHLRLFCNPFLKFLLLKILLPFPNF